MSNFKRQSHQLAELSCKYWSVFPAPPTLWGKLPRTATGWVGGWVGNSTIMPHDLTSSSEVTEWGPIPLPHLHGLPPSGWSKLNSPSGIWLGKVTASWKRAQNRSTGMERGQSGHSRPCTNGRESPSTDSEAEISLKLESPSPSNGPSLFLGTIPCNQINPDQDD